MRNKMELAQGIIDSISQKIEKINSFYFALKIRLYKKGLDQLCQNQLLGILIIVFNFGCNFVYLKNLDSEHEKKEEDSN